MCNIIITVITSYQVNLVFHQSDQRTNNNGNTIAESSPAIDNKETFTATRWHNHKSVLPRKQGFNSCYLAAFKIYETKIFAGVPCAGLISCRPEFVD